MRRHSRSCLSEDGRRVYLLPDDEIFRFGGEAVDEFRTRVGLFVSSTKNRLRESTVVGDWVPAREEAPPGSDTLILAVVKINKNYLIH